MRAQNDLKFADRLAAFALYVILRLLLMTLRVRIVGLEHRRAAERLHPAGAFAIGIFHENAIASVGLHRGQKFAPLCSLSRDGALVASICTKLGFNPIRGSSSRGGAEARSQLVEMIAAGYPTAITVDGPRGPRRVPKPGIVALAKRTGIAMLPMAAIASRYWVFHKAWDKTRFPKPFSPVTLAYGPPILVPNDISEEGFEAKRAELARALEQLETNAASRLSPDHVSPRG